MNRPFVFLMCDKSRQISRALLLFSSLIDSPVKKEKCVCVPRVQTHQPNHVEHILRAKAVFLVYEQVVDQCCLENTPHLPPLLIYDMKEIYWPLVINIFPDSISCFQWLYNIIYLQQYTLD